MILQPALVCAGDGLAPLEDRFDPLQLFDAESAIQLRDAIVVAELLVLEPLAGRASPLIPELPGPHRDVRVVRDDDAAFTGRDLLVRIEAEDTRISERAHLAALVFRAERFASVFDHEEPMAVGDLLDLGERRGTAKGMHHDDGARAGCNCLLDPGGIEIQRLGIDIDEDPRRSLLTRRAGDGHERERWDDDLVAARDAESADAEVKAAGSRVDGNGVRGPE